jgi:hypothetical protein
MLHTFTKESNNKEEIKIEKFRMNLPLTAKYQQKTQANPI